MDHAIRDRRRLNRNPKGPAGSDIPYPLRKVVRAQHGTTCLGQLAQNGQRHRINAPLRVASGCPFRRHIGQRSGVVHGFIQYSVEFETHVDSKAGLAHFCEAVPAGPRIFDRTRLISSRSHHTGSRFHCVLRIVEGQAAALWSRSEPVNSSAKFQISR